jgi:hypothetical protein
VGLLTGLSTAPFRGLFRLAEVIHEQADRELHDPAAVRRRLEDVEEAREAGRISEDDEAEAQQEILGSMIRQPGGDEVTDPGTQGEER